MNAVIKKGGGVSVTAKQGWEGYWEGGLNQVVAFQFGAQGGAVNTEH